METALDSYRELLEAKDELEETIKKCYEARAQEEEEMKEGFADLLPSDVFAEEREDRALKRWKHFFGEWEGFKLKMAKKLGKDVSDLVVSRSEEYREIVSLRKTLTPKHLRQ